MNVKHFPFFVRRSELKMRKSPMVPEIAFRRHRFENLKTFINFLVTLYNGVATKN